MSSTRCLFVAVVVSLPSPLFAQGLRSDVAPERRGYPSPIGLAEYPNQGPIGLSRNEVQRVLELARFMETGEREAFDRIFNRTKDKRDDYLNNLRVGYDWERPVNISPYAASPPPVARYELRTRTYEPFKLRSFRGQKIPDSGPRR